MREKYNGSDCLLVVLSFKSQMLIVKCPPTEPLLVLCDPTSGQGGGKFGTRSIGFEKSSRKEWQRWLIRRILAGIFYGYSLDRANQDNHGAQ